MQQWEAARKAADEIADRLATPADARRLHQGGEWRPQSLAYGTVGVALLHIERARRGLGSWSRVHAWLAAVAKEPTVGGTNSHLYYGAPALAFAVNAAADRLGRRYKNALATLDEQVTGLVRHRVRHGLARMERHELPALAEFDTLRGLAGLCALLLRRGRHHDLLRDVLSYLVMLTEPVKADGDLLPGWWSDLAPNGRRDPEFPYGHANNGLAHGIGGPLAALALASLRGVTVPGQREAMQRICAWLDQWRQAGPTGPWWPYWITREQLRTSDPGLGPGRPSWCYGTPGLARAQQLAALALGDPVRQRMAEEALLCVVKDPGQLRQITDMSLCHGYAGLLHITQAVAVDAVTPQLYSASVPNLLDVFVGGSTRGCDGAETLVHVVLDSQRERVEVGLLDGAAGVALALYSAYAWTPPPSGWNACFLLS